MDNAPEITIAPLSTDDYTRWLVLWDSNNQGQSNPLITAETWKRLIAADSTVHGLVARYGGEIAGLLHYILHPVTGHIQPVCYMQDVFVDPASRRKGIARALVHELARIGKQEQWARIYWLAENDNEAAQQLYRDIGLKLNFSLHILPL